MQSPNFQSEALGTLCLRNEKIQKYNTHNCLPIQQCSFNFPVMEVIPLVVLHGWPGSVREFYDLIPLLTTPRKDINFVFEVIAPSLPGYGFSEGAHRPGMGAAQIGVVIHKLMQRLGFQSYYVQGGDWGSIIGRNMALLYPQKYSFYYVGFDSWLLQLTNNMNHLYFDGHQKKLSVPVVENYMS